MPNEKGQDMAVDTNQWVHELPEEKLSVFLEKHGESLKKKYGVEDEHFAVWLHHLDSRVTRKVGLSFQDLEDWDFWSAYDSDLSPKDAAEDMLEDLGYDFG